MKQVTQSVADGRLEVVSGPAPLAGPMEVLVANEVSLISAGTERSLRALARKSLLAKARARPDQVRRVLEKIRQGGLLSTVRQVRARLDETMPLGYSSAGVVVACGAGVSELKPGDRVASNGPHASVVAVPKHLCALVPEGVGSDAAAFTVLASIALQGVRLAEVGLGDRVLVIGLGLVGQLTVALLKAAGCRVIGTDPEAPKCELAGTMGAEIAAVGVDAAAVESFTGGLGADAVLVTASTPSNAPLELAGRSVRKKGRVVAVGMVGLDVPRRDFYAKEAELVVSCSYGPGRYDAAYEERGLDYPAAYVRWTEQRNMQAVLDLMATGRLDVTPLISHRFPIEEASRAYELIEKGDEPVFGVLLEYEGESALAPSIATPERAPRASGDPTLGFVGAGSFARGVLLPAIAGSPVGARLKSVCSAGGLSAIDAVRKSGFELAAAEEAEIYADPEIDAVFITTRHRLHAPQVRAALAAGKHVFVEKPLALTADEVAEIERELASPGAGRPLLQVGFNRRFSPAAAAVRAHFAAVGEPLSVVIRVNAGSLPADHWAHDPEEGGRILGEACHFIDLATFLLGSPPVRVFAESVGGPRAPATTDDRCLLTLRHANGSVSSVAYLAGGDRALAKERVEVFGGERAAVIDDFRTVELFAGGRRGRRRYRGQDKGHRAEVTAFLQAVRDGAGEPIEWPEIRAVTLASIRALESLRSGFPLDVGG